MGNRANSKKKYKKIILVGTKKKNEKPTKSFFRKFIETLFLVIKTIATTNRERNINFLYFNISTKKNPPTHLGLTTPKKAINQKKNKKEISLKDKKISIIIK